MNGPRYIETDAILHKFRERSFKIHQDKINKIKNRSIALKRENNKCAYSFDSPLKEPDTKTISLKYDTNESQIVQESKAKNEEIELSPNIEKQLTYDNNLSPLLNAHIQHQSLNLSNSKLACGKISQNNSACKNRNSFGPHKNLHSYIQYMDDDYSLISMVRETKKKNFRYQLTKQKEEINFKNQILMGKLMAITSEKSRYKTSHASQYLGSLNYVVRK